MAAGFKRACPDTFDAKPFGATLPCRLKSCRRVFRSRQAFSSQLRHPFKGSFRLVFIFFHGRWGFGGVTGFSFFQRWNVLNKGQVSFVLPHRLAQRFCSACFAFKLFSLGLPGSFNDREPHRHLARRATRVCRRTVRRLHERSSLVLDVHGSHSHYDHGHIISDLLISCKKLI
jgi:hypothetical protein